MAFCYLWQQLREQFGDHPPTRSVLADALHALARQIAAHGPFNMMLSDGSALFAHCSTKLYYLIRQHPFATAQLSDEDLSVDFSQVTTPLDRVAVIVTEPLTSNAVTYTTTAVPANKEGIATSGAGARQKKRQ